MIFWALCLPGVQKVKGNLISELLAILVQYEWKNNINESNVFLRTNFLELGDIHKYLLNKPWLKNRKLKISFHTIMTLFTMSKIGNTD